ncbi:MAG TPA: hypothetical protein VK709_08185 [Candidatus Saccharimonadales bacterium]|jgi:hypothetical protein|nr:hypothetical protein [Candidatus Saccharimonadales bacterium]
MLKKDHKSNGNRLQTLLQGVISCLPVVIFLLTGTPAQAQLNSNIAGVNLAANLTTSLTVTASPGLVNFPLIRSGITNGSATITINTSWTLSPSVGSVKTYAYFTSAAAALTDGAGDNIPSTSVSESVDGGAFGAFTGVSPYAAASSVTVSTIRILGNNKSGTQSDTLNMRINTTGLNLPAANYTGVLTIQAQAL